jgi:hypothetical protein
VFTPVLGEWGVMFKGGGHFFFSDYHFCRAVMMREGSICENVFLSIRKGWFHHKHGLWKRRRSCRTAKYSRYQADSNPLSRRLWPDHGPLGFQGSYPNEFLIFWLVCLEVATSLRVIWGQWVLMQGGGMDVVM